MIIKKASVDYCFSLLRKDFSLMPVDHKTKIPVMRWKSFMDTKMTDEEFSKNYGLGNAIGLITGYDGLEVIDVDLKVFEYAKEKGDTWNTLLSMWRETIHGFDDKFVIYKTMNDGYHILYKSNEVQGNKKIAKVKGIKEALIETRGKRGYVYLYEGNNLSKKKYEDIRYIEKSDRDKLFQVCEYFNYKEEPIIEETPLRSPVPTDGVTAWDDYNSKVSVLDIVGDEFDIKRSISDRHIIKRHGAKSPHSGYIYKDTKCMFLFSTGTQYPAEKLLSPFAVYTHKYHYGDFSRSAKDLYKKGYGDRVTPQKLIDEPGEIIDENVLEDISFPLEVFPVDYQNYIMELHKKYNFDVDYMCCTLIWCFSLMIGNSLKLKIKNNLFANANVWMCLIGSRGTGKSPALDTIMRPISVLNQRNINNYMKKVEAYEQWRKLEGKDKKEVAEVMEPVKNDLIVSDVTMEALMDIHSNNPNGIGVYRDEIVGWFKDMNRYRSGSDEQNWLTSWNNGMLSAHRKTARSTYVKKSFIPVIGGLQPEILGSFYNKENESNGFMDRVLFCYPESSYANLTIGDIPQELTDRYNSKMEFFKSVMDKDFGNVNENGDIISETVSLTDSALHKLIDHTNSLTEIQRGDDEPGYVKSAISKQKIYLGRFALILNTVHAMEADSDMYTVDSEYIDKAMLLVEYFINNLKKVKGDINTSHNVEKVVEGGVVVSNYNKVIELYKNYPNLTQKKIADAVGVSRKTVNKYLVKYRKDEIEKNEG